MSDFTASFNGHTLNDLFTVGQPERTLVPWEPNLMDGGPIGSIFAGTKAQALQVTLTLTTFAETVEERLFALRTLSGWLAVDSPKSLILSDERYSDQQVSLSAAKRLAVPTGAPQIVHAHDAATATVTFVCPDPRLRNQYRSVSLDPAGAVTFDVVGNAPTEPRIILNGAHGDSSNVLRFSVKTERAGEATKTRTYDLTVNGTYKITMDCGKRTLTYSSGATSTDVLLSPAYDWPEMVGGHTVTVTFSKGGFTTGIVAYDDMWW